MLQSELLEIVKVKSEHFARRFKSEFKQDLDDTLTRHNIKPINEDLMNMPMDQTGKDIIIQFQENIRRLREFLTRVDKDMDDVFQEDAQEDDLDGQSQFSTSVSQLRHLLKNYRALTEAQEAVIQSDLAVRGSLPTPDEIVTPNTRFRVITNQEIENMRSRLNEHRIIYDKDQKEIELRRKYVAEVAKQLDEDKMKIANERDQLIKGEHVFDIDDKIEIIRDNRYEESYQNDQISQQ